MSRCAVAAAGWLLALLVAGCSSQPAEGQGEENTLTAWRRLDVLPVPEATVSWEEAGAYLGRSVAVEGRIVRTNNTGRICFLNFKEEWRGSFTLVIFSQTFREFAEAPEELFRGKRVRAVGKVEDYRGAPQIVLENPEQIVILEP